MKKYGFLCLMMLIMCPDLQARGSGGAAVAGALGGLAVGTMIGSASANSSQRSSRAEQEAIRAQDMAEQLRIDRERERIAQLEREIQRRDVEHKIAQSQQQGGNSMQVLLIVLVSMLLLAVIVLSIFVFRR